jgi:serine O-acetyltransferase
MTMAPAATDARPGQVYPPLNRGDRDGNPPGIGFLALVREDLQAHGGDWLEQGFWAVAVHRLGNWRMDRPRLVRAPLTLVYRFLYKWVEWTCGITLPYTVRVGRRVRIWHHSGIVINAHSIGDDVHIRQNTTFGLAGRGEPEGAVPTIGDRVDIGCNVTVAGGVMVGADSKIGANTLVIADVPPGAVVVGVPARIISQPTGVNGG